MMEWRGRCSRSGEHAVCVFECVLSCAWSAVALYAWKVRVILLSMLQKYSLEAGRCVFVSHGLAAIVDEAFGVKWLGEEVADLGEILETNVERAGWFGV